jgi:hypothetical protein
MFLSVSVTEHSEEILWILMSNILRNVWYIPAILIESMLQFVAKYFRWTRRQGAHFCVGKWKFRKIRFWRNRKHMFSGLQLCRYSRLYKTAVTYQGSYISDQNCDSYAVPSQNPQICTLSLGKGKAVPLQAWTGPEGRRLRLPDFKTIGAPAAFTPRRYSC